MQRELPRGLVTFVFTDIEGSTALFRRLGSDYPPVLHRHRELVRSAAESNGGHEIGEEGDSLLLVFQHADDAVSACLAAQSAIAAEPWAAGIDVRLRIGIHTGSATPHADRYVSMTVHQAARIVATAHGGQIVASQNTREALTDSFGVGLTDLGRFSVRDFDEPIHLYQIDSGDQPGSFAAPRALPAAGHNLDLPSNSFVGRDVELVSVIERLQPGRLVTIVGPGGIGKTRLAAEVGISSGDTFPGGVWNVELASLSDGSEVADTVAAAIGATTTDDAAAAVGRHLAGERTLLLLDNCEHVTAAVAALVRAVTRDAPLTTVLATSREPIGLPGELVRTLAPLVATEGNDPAVRLFIDRARDIDDTFEPSARDLDDIGLLVDRLDRLPFAIELAAARTRVLSPGEISQRLADLLTPDAPPDPALDTRRQTLWSTIDWSYQLLGRSTRRLFEALAVFPGSFDLSAVEHICSEIVDPTDVFELMNNLVQASLCTVHRRTAGTRFEYLSTVRSFARSKPAGDASEVNLDDRHAEYFSTMAAGSDALLKGPDQASHTRLLRAEEANLDAALTRLRAVDAPAASAMTAELARYWFRTGQLAKGAALMEASLAAEDRETAATGRLKQWLGFFAVVRGDLEAARLLTLEALRIGEQQQDPIGVAYAYNGLGAIASQEGSPSEAAKHWKASVELFDELEPAWGTAPMFNLGYALVELGNWDEVELVGERLQRVDDEEGPPRALGLLLQSYGAFGVGDLDCAVRLGERALDLFEIADDLPHMVEVHILLMEIAEANGEVDRARFELRRARNRAPELPGLDEPEGLIARARIAIRARDLRVAARLLQGCLDAVRMTDNAALASDFFHELARMADLAGRPEASTLAAASAAGHAEVGITKRAHILAERRALLGDHDAEPADLDAAWQLAARLIADLVGD